MIWATVSSWSYFCWLYSSSPSLAAKNTINLISVLTMCRVFSCVVGRGCLLWPVHSPGKTLLAFALLHSVFQAKFACYSRYFLTSYFCIPVPYNEKKKNKKQTFLGVSSRRSQYVSNFGKLSSGHRIGKGQFSFQSQRKTMPKNAQTIAQLHSSHTLVKIMLKNLQARLQ